MTSPAEFVALLNAQLDEMTSLIRRLVNIDSGSYDAQGVNRVQDVFTEKFREAGFEVMRKPLPGFGDQLTARWRGGEGKRVLILGHADTVWPAGTAAAWPFRANGEFYEGPGVGDMKGCVVMALYALRELIPTGDAGVGSITVLIVPDEEIGSVGSRAWIESEAGSADFCLTLEPARPNRGLVIGRGGVGKLEVQVEGVTAHIAHNRWNGASAVAALAPLVAMLESVSNEDRKVSVSVGIFEGGEARQVIPARAHLLADLRAADQPGADSVLSEIAACMAKIQKTTDPRIKFTYEARFTRPPFPASAGSRALFALADLIAEELGTPVAGVISAGGSDANLAAAVGIPTLDGLGPITHEMCSRRERLEIASIAPHGALLASLIRRGGRDPKLSRLSSHDGGMQ